MSFFSVVEDLSPFNAILGRTWLHSMKAIPSTYHQVVSFITQNGQVDLYGSQLAARQCYQITRETGPSTNREQSPKEASPPDHSNYRTRRTRILRQQTPSKPFKFQRRKGALHTLAPSYDQKKNRSFKMYFNKIEMSSLGPTSK